MSSGTTKATIEGGNHRQQLLDKMHFLGQMSSTETALFHQAAAATYGLGITDMKTVSVLMQEGPKTAGQLGERLSLTTGAITNVIDRLERSDVVKRSRDDKDRRKVIVSVIEDKFDNQANVYDSIGQAFEKLLSDYSTSELEFLVKFYEKSIELTQLEIAKLSHK